jgi:hypothetical protein
VIRGAALGASLLATLASPATWVLSLLAFLIRGGLVVVLGPIVTVPSAVGLGNILGPALTDLVLGDPLTGVLVVGGGGLLVIGAWLALGGWIAATAETETIRRIAADDDVGLADRRRLAFRRGTASRILLARLVALVPLSLALTLGGLRVVTVAYRELTVPSSTGEPLVWRVVAGSADALALILVTWLVGELLGGLAARRIALSGEGVLAALAGASVGVLRHPGRALLGLLVPTATLLAVLVVSGLASSAAWTALRAGADDATGITTVLLVPMLVGLWLGGLTLIGLVTAWRGAVWTVQLAGTFGVLPTTRPGEWNAEPTSGTLADLRPQGAETDSR